MQIARAGNFKQRTRKSSQVSRQLREQRRQRIVCQTHEAIEDFDNYLRAFEIARDADADVPEEAGVNNSAGMLRQGTTRQRSCASSESSVGQAGDDASELSATDKTTAVKLRRWRSAGILGNVRIGASSGEVLTMPHVEKDPHEMRPPSPLSRYDYGSISQRPKSELSQLLGSSRPKHRQQSQGFYFPGNLSKQGPYGFSLLDPVLLPPQNWKSSQQLPVRWEGGASDLRPATAPDLDSRRSAGSPVVPESVNTNRAHSRRAERVHRSIDRRREDAFLEQVRFENGVFEGKWSDPLLDRSGELLEQAPQLEYGWLAEVEDKTEDVDPSKALAVKILNGLDEAMERSRSMLCNLFSAEDRGTPSILETDAFCRGLIRTGVLDASKAKRLDVAKALLVIDPKFDGLVNLRMLSRAVAAAQALRHKREHASRAAQHQHHERITNMYSDSLPLDVVKVEKNPRSLYDFEKSLEKFQRQQRDLLVLHKEVRGNSSPVVGGK